MVNTGSITYILLAILIVVLLIAIFIALIKRVFKFLIFILILFIVYLGYQYIVNSITPMEFINGIKIDISYLIKSAQNYSKIKKSSDEIKKIIDSGDLSEEAIDKIVEENNKLYKIKDEMISLPHSKVLDQYHSLYVLNLDKSLATSDAMVLMIRGKKESGDLINNLKEKVNTIFDYIKDIK